MYAQRCRLVVLRMLFSVGLGATCLSAAVRIETPVPFPQEADPQAAADGAKQPRLIKSVDPVTPAEGEELKHDQRVYVSFVVDARGLVSNVSTMFDPPTVFGQSAIAAVKQWEFEPGLHYFSESKRLVPVYTQMTVLITFPAAATPPSAR